jgi:acyl-CoA hydrolase
LNKKSTKRSVEVINTELVFPTHANHYGTIFGGRVLELMDTTGALAAMRFANEEAVTASIEAIDFKRPIKVGDIIELKGRVIYTANTSMVVKVDVYKINKFSSKEDYSCSGHLIFVAVDANGEPRAVPALRCVTKEEKKYWKIGEEIKKRAKERRERESQD